MNGIDGHRTQCVYLLTDLHNPEFGCYRRTGTPVHHQRSQHRSEFPDQTQCDRRARVRRGAELGKRILALNCKHRTGKAADKGDYRNGLHPDGIQLLDKQTWLIRRFERADKHSGQKSPRSAERRDETNDLAARLSYLLNQSSSLNVRFHRLLHL